MKVFISTFPFGDVDRRPLVWLEENGVEYTLNNYGRKMTEGELAEVIDDYDVLIAGTEPISNKVLNNAKKLRLISRVGIGLDSVDLIGAKNRNIDVSYTPDAPSPAVAELTIGLMLALIRHVHESTEAMRRGKWVRKVGTRLSESVVGILGIGRIGKLVINHLEGFHCKQLLLHDIDDTLNIETKLKHSWCDLETLLSESDILSIHVPLTSITNNLIGKNQLNMMKAGSILINTARGGIVNEEDLYEALISGHLSGAAIDVFCDEPYVGPLARLSQCILTAHMGSMSVDCRLNMEEQATMEVIRLAKGEPLENSVPIDEYELRIHH